MQKLSDVDQIKDLGPAKTAAITIGNFDGCHLGHQRLIAATLAHAAALTAKSIALTFTPRPDVFLNLTPPGPMLFTEAQKTRALAELGLDLQVAQAFDEQFASRSPAAFYEQILRERLHAAAVVVGYNFRFGHKRSGDVAYLEERARADQVRTTIGAPAMQAGDVISSTRIRTALRERGDVADVATMLGRPYSVAGEIRRGDQLGRQLGVPTANLEGIEQLLPAFGVYAGFVELEAPRATLMQLPKSALPAVFSLGVRPTIAQKGPPPVRVEAHILSAGIGENALYGCAATYYLTHRLRGEETFDSLETLKVQMAADIEQAREATLRYPR